MKKVLFLPLMCILLISFVSPNIISAKETTKKDSVEQNSADIQYYNADNKLVDIESFYKGSTNVVSAKSTSVNGRFSFYDFGRASFSNYLWVKKGAAFKNPDSMALEVMGSAKQLEVWMYTANGKYHGKGVAKNATHWVTFNWKPLAKKGKSYKFKLVSAKNSGKINIKQGSLEYNYKW